MLDKDPNAKVAGQQCPHNASNCHYHRAADDKFCCIRNSLLPLLPLLPLLALNIALVRLVVASKQNESASSNLELPMKPAACSAV